jgi:cation diffusion facilitator family transporter
MARAQSSRRVIYAALAGNTLIALIKFAAAAYTGSSAMLAEGVHSVVDTGNQALLLYGLRRARLPPDEQFPFGYGKEVYFWSFVVAIQLFTVGSGIAMAKGIFELRHPQPLHDIGANYVVLALSAVFEGATWIFAVDELAKAKGKRTLLQAVQHGKDPSRFMVIFEDTASLLGLAIAAGAIAAQQLTGIVTLDGIASILIALVLAVTAFWLAYETKGLLIGESANREVVQDIERIARDIEGIREVREVLSVHMGPDYILVTLCAVLTHSRTADSGRAVRLLEQRIKQAHPRVRQVCVKALPPD